MKCKACGETLNFETSREGTQPGEHQGHWYCFDCWNEVAKGVVNVRHMHGAKLYSAGSGCPLERPGSDDPSPWEENNVRTLEDGQ